MSQTLAKRIFRRSIIFSILVEVGLGVQTEETVVTNINGKQLETITLFPTLEDQTGTSKPE